MSENDTTNETAETRKQVRRNRLKAKIEEARCQALGIKPEINMMEDEDPEKSRISFDQTVKSKDRLQKLVSDGYQLVTGVSVAGEAREVSRRQDEAEARKSCYERMEAETNASIERFDEIMRKWSQFKEAEIPQNVRDLINQQKMASEEMVDEKNKVVNELEEELKLKDEQYVKQLKKQADDIELLVERMEEQAHSLIKAFHEELEEIERVYAIERQDLVTSGISTVKDKTQERSDMEAHYLKVRDERIEENEAKLNHLRVSSREELHEIKIKLETDVQNLQQQIQQMKATFHLNAEKLEYNFQVLKKRDEENVIIISQQKRKITKLQDTLNNLRMKLAKQEKSNQSGVESLLAEYQKNIDQYKELQKKFKHFQSVDVNQFTEIWRMNENKARSLLNDIQSVDKHIHEQLGLEYQIPDEIPNPLSQPFFTKTNKRFSHATLYASQILSDTKIDNAPVNDHAGTTPSQTNISMPYFVKKQVLELIATESSFLIESKLPHLLASLGKEEQILMQLDSIFKALNITTENDVEELIKFFVIPDEADPACLTIIDSNDVSNALSSFANSHKTSTVKNADKNSEVKAVHLERNDITTEMLKSPFWKTLQHALPKHHEKIWTTLISGLEQYQKVLSNRSKLINEMDSIRQQNQELRLLLNQYMRSDINIELQVPPVLTMPR
jgi:dynein regulatory complex protein 1